MITWIRNLLQRKPAVPPPDPSVRVENLYGYGELTTTEYFDKATGTVVQGNTTFH